MQHGDGQGTCLSERIAGQAVIEQLIRSHEQTRPRGTLARILGISPLTSDEQAWYVGALGEGVVGRMLTALDDRWTVLHAVPVGSGTSDVDHVVIGPGGVFTVNTKHHHGQSIWVASRAFMVSGQKKPYLRNSEYEAERAAVRLSRVLPPELDVTPVIALVSPKSITFKEHPAFVKVLDARSLVRWLRKRPAVLDAGQVAAIVVAAEGPGHLAYEPHRSSRYALAAAALRRARPRGAERAPGSADLGDRCPHRVRGRGADDDAGLRPVPQRVLRLRAVVARRAKRSTHTGCTAHRIGEESPP